MGAVNLKPIPNSRGLLIRDFLLNHITCAENWRKVRNQFQVFNVLDHVSIGYIPGTTDASAALTAAVAASGGASEILFPPGAYRIASNTTINYTMIFLPGATLKPDSGIAVTIGSNSKITAFENWQDTSAGGTFTVSGGSFEHRILTRVTSPTGGLVINEGSPQNSLDESSGVSFVRGGTQGFPHSLGSASELSVIGGGYDNHIGDTCSATTVAGGAHHEVADDSSHTFIGGGAYQKSYAAYAVLAGGTLNSNYSTYGFMGGGHENTLGDSGVTPIDQRASVLVGGYQNIVKGIRSTHVGGIQNSTTGDKAFGGGGILNTTSGENAVIPGGQSNTASAKNTGITHGQGNTASALAARAGGEDNTASGNYAVAEGENNSASATYSRAVGGRSSAPLFGQHAHGSGYFAARGDAQSSDLVARNVTVGSQTVNLDLSGSVATNPIALPANTSWCFRIRLIARNISASENGAWTFEGALKRDATAASTALIGTVASTAINAPAGWTPTVQADTTAGALQIQVSTSVAVTGTIRWVARIELVEAAG